MTVSTFAQPSYPDQLGTTYPTNIDSCVNVLAQIGQDFAPHAASSPNLTVLIDAGKIIKADGTLVSQAQQTATFVAPVTNPRIDRIVIDMLTGVYSIIAGTEAASPAAPAITAGKLPCAQVSLTVGITQIANANITDERTAFVSPPQITTHTATGTDTYTVSGLTLVSGFDYRITFTNANATTTPTVNGTTIKREGSAALLVGDIAANYPTILRHNGTDLILVNPSKSRTAGAVVYLTSQNILTATLTTINWVSELYDTSGCHDNVTNNTRLTVPAGYTKARLTGGIMFTSNSTGNRDVQLLSNGGARAIGTPFIRGAGASTVSLEFSTAIIPVVAGDYFECEVSQDSGVTLGITGGTAPGGSYFSIELFN